MGFQDSLSLDRQRQLPSDCKCRVEAACVFGLQVLDRPVNVPRILQTIAPEGWREVDLSGTGDSHELEREEPRS